MLGNFEIKHRDLNLLPDVTNTSDLSSICSVFFCLPTFQFNSLSDYASQSVWLTSIAYKYIYPLHNLIESTSNSEEPELREGRDNRRVKNREGKYRFSLWLVCDIDYYIRLKEYEGRELKCYLGDINGNLIGVKDGSAVKGFTVDSIFVNRISMGNNQPAWTNIIIDLSNPAEILSGYHIKPSFDFESLYNVTCTIDNITQIDSDTFDFDVLSPCSEGIEGLIASNFILTDNINGSITVNSLVDNGDGNYRINGAEDFYSGSIRLVSSHYNGLENYNFVVPQYNPTQYNNTQYNIS